MTSTRAAADMEQALTAIGADVEVTHYSSGAVDLLVRRSSVLVSIQGTSDGEWGYSVNPHPRRGVHGPRPRHRRP